MHKQSVQREYYEREIGIPERAEKTEGGKDTKETMQWKFPELKMWAFN